jgi:alkanesulfonate monooxygenase SsuD/methylene tetrahydromethanopterin reductase-like flavin-dependent oxidoreductase (luciferase family)
MVEVGVALLGSVNSVRELIQTAKDLEGIGVDSIMIPDDLPLRDVFVSASAIVSQTEHITVSFVTNPYTRHPVMIAKAVASLTEIAPSRIQLNLAAGGSFTLKPLGIPMWNKPVERLRETILICRGLLEEGEIDFEEEIFTAHNVKLDFPFSKDRARIFLMGRGFGTLRLAGELGDGAYINPISPAYERMVINEIFGAAMSNRRDPSRLTLGSTVTLSMNKHKGFTEKDKLHIASEIHDIPISVLRAFKDSMTPSTIDALLRIHDAPSVKSAIPFLTKDVVELFPDETCTLGEVVELVKERKKNGYKAISLVLPYGEEIKFIKLLDRRLVDKLHES